MGRRALIAQTLVCTSALVALVTVAAGTLHKIISPAFGHIIMCLPWLNLRDLHNKKASCL